MNLAALAQLSAYHALAKQAFDVPGSDSPGSTHGMLGFPTGKPPAPAPQDAHEPQMPPTQPAGSKPQGGRGGYAPPNFGNAHSRDRADPDFGGAETPQAPMAGFKIASGDLAAAAILAGVAPFTASDALPGMAIGAGGAYLAGGKPLHGMAIGGGVTGGMSLGRVGGQALGHVGAHMLRELGFNNVADNLPDLVGLGGRLTGAAVGGYAGHRLGKHLTREQPKPEETPAEKVGRIVKRAGAMSEFGQSLGQAGQTVASAAQAPVHAVRSLYHGAKGLGHTALNVVGAGLDTARAGVNAIRGGEKEAAAAALLSKNLLDVLTLNAELVEKQASRCRVS